MLQASNTSVAQLLLAPAHTVVFSNWLLWLHDTSLTKPALLEWVCDQVLLAETATFVLCGLDCLLSWNNTLFEILFCFSDNWIQLQMLASFENQRGWKTFESHGLLYCIWNWGEESTLTVSFLVCVQFVSLPFDSNATRTYFVPGSNMQKNLN